MRKNKVLLTLFFFFFSFILPAQYAWKWSVTNGSSYEHIRSLAADNAGNIYITGYFADTCPFFGDTIISAIGNDFFTASFDPEGNFRWVRTGRVKYNILSRNGMLENICVAGNYVYVTGEFNDTLIFDVDTIISRRENVSDVFLVKYDLEGNVLWAVSGGSNGMDFSHAVAADDSGNVYVIGEIGWSADFGDHSVPRFVNWDIFFAKYDSAGVCRWAKSAGGILNDYGSGIKVVNEALFITGTFTSTAVFDMVTVTPDENNDLFIARYNTNGKMMEFVPGGGKNIGAVQGMVVDKYMNVYLAGTYLENITIGDTTLSTGGGKNTFLVRYKPGEGFIWAQSFKLAGSLFPSRYLNYNNENRVIFSGKFIDSLRLGSIRLDAVAPENVFLAVLDSTGSFDWGVVAGGSITADPTGCAANAGEHYYLAGEFTGQLTTGQATFDQAGFNNFFLAKAVEGSSFSGEQYSRQPIRITVKPNPVENIATLSYSIPVSGEVKIGLYDMLGKKVWMLDDKLLQQGTYTLQLDVSGLPAGMYFVKVQTGYLDTTLKMMVVR